MVDYFAEENIAVLCLYFDFRGQEERAAANIIGTLTKQLVNALKVVPTGIEEAFERAECEVGGRGLQVSEAVKLLQAALPLIKRTFICIDALDECLDKHIFKLLTSLHAASQASPNIRLYITRRPHIRSAVEKYLPAGAQVISIDSSNADIRVYLEMELGHDLDSETMSPTLRVDIMKRIPEKISDAYVMASPTPQALRDR